MSVCNLERNPNGGGYTEASIKELREFIAGKLYDAQEEAEYSGGDYSRTTKRLLKRALQEIGDNYNNVYLTEIVKQTEDILKNEFPIWWEASDNGRGGYLPENGIKNTISKSARKTSEDKVEYNEQVDEDDSSLPSYFLDKVFGNKAVLKNEIKQEATHILLNNFIIDRKNGTLVTNIAEANRNARNQKNELFTDIITSLATDEDMAKLEGISLVIYDEEGKYTGIMENPDIINIMDRRYPFDIWNGVKIQELADKALRDDNAAKLYRTFKNWFLLKNYDNFTKLLLGEAVTINPAAKNKYISGDNYMFSNKSSNLLTTWRPDDGLVDLKVEISALAQSLVNSTPFLKLGVSEPVTSGGKLLYLKFEDFYRIVTKLKDTVLNTNADIKINDPQGRYNQAFLDMSMQEQMLVLNKTLAQIINNIRLNPQVYGRLAFKIIMDTARNADDGSQTMKDLGFSEQDIDKMWSIYEGFFDDSNKSSIVSIQYGMRPQEGQDPTISQGYDHNVQNYYALMTQVMDSMFSVNYLQFYDDTGAIQVRTLKELGSDNTRQTIENNIYNTNSRRITKFNFEEVCLKPYRAEPTYFLNTETKKPEHVNGILFKIDNVVVTDAYGKEINLGNLTVKYLIESLIIEGPDGKEIPNWQKELFAKSPKGLKFIEEQLCVNIAQNAALNNAIEALFSTESFYSKLFDLATEIYFNRYLSNVELRDTSDWQVSEARLGQIYGAATGKIPGFNSWLKEIKLASDSALPILEKLSQAHTLATGQATSAQVRDADGNMISQQTLSRLLGYLPAQWDMIQDYMKGLEDISGYKMPFSLFKSGMYKGHLTIKELKSMFGNKAATQFTVAEFMQATFLHTFVGGFINDERKIVHDHTVGFLPSVNSDKNTIGQILIDLNLPCSRFEKSPRYFELTQNQIATLIAEELGDSYKLTRESIIQDFAKLQQFVNVELGLTDVVLNPDHFIEINKWANAHGKSAADLLFEWTQEYNHRYPNAPIKLTDQVHFIQKGTTIAPNDTLQELLQRYSSADNVQKFLNIKRAEMFNSLLNEGFQINLFSGENTSKAASFLRDSYQDWVNHGNMVLGRLIYKGKQYKISSKVDLQEFQNETGLDVLSDIHAVSNIPGLSFELHPMLDKYNSLDYLFTQEFMIAGVGSHIAHPAKKAGDPMFREAQRFLAQHKRNVSYTAAMHEYQLGQINGIPTEYNMAMMEDVPAWVYTMSGDMKSDADSFDGATFVNPWVIEWENNSLNSAKAGIDKKPFVHFYDERTHTGGIIKTAGFGVTNDRVRNHKFYRDMIFNMTHRPWLDEAGNRLRVTGKGILEDFNKRQVNYGPVYFFRDGKYYMRTIDSFVEGAQSYMVTDTEVDENGNSKGGKADRHVLPAITSNYGIYQMFGGWDSMEVVDGKLQWSEKSRELTAMACNNYGFKRAGVVGNARTADDVFQPMKHSDIHYMPTSGAVKQGIGNVNPHDYFFKKVAHSDGYSNLNFMKVKMLQAGIQLDKEHHADNSVISLMTQVISAACAKGFMPQYSENLYNALYELTKVGTNNFRDELGKLNIGVSGDEEAFKNAATKIILKTIMSSTASDGDMMVSIANELMNELRTSRNFSLTKERLDKANEIIPYSSPEIFRKVVTSLSVALTKEGIKVKMPGNLAVLCPTHGIIKMYKVPYVDDKGVKHTKHLNYGDLERLYGNEENIQKNLQLLQEQEPEVTNVSDIELGFNYLAQTAGGPVIYKVVKPNRTLNLESLEPVGQSNGIAIYEVGYQDIKNMMASKTISKLLEYIMDGQDLRSYNVRFKVGDLSYQMADLDIVQDYFEVKELKKKPLEQLNRILQLTIKYGRFEEFCDRLARAYSNNWNDKDLTNPEHRNIIAAVRRIKDSKFTIASGLNVIIPERILPMVTNFGLGFLNRVMQLNLNGISPNSNDVTVIIDKQPLQVDKDSIKIQSYGCIMPKVFKSNFGLEQYDSIEEIKEDPDFFLKRLVKNASTHVENIPVLKEDGVTVDHIMANYHLELKRLDGKHIYIRNGKDDSTLTTKVNWIPRIENGKVYRVDIDNNIIYQMFSEKDEIYLDDEGNEIIVTHDTDLTFETDKGTQVPTKKVKWFKDTGQYMTTDTKEVVTPKSGSGIQFYLDNFDYFTININSEADEANFINIRNRAGISKNTMARKVSAKLTGQINEKRAIAKKLNDYEKLLENKDSEDAQHLVEKANQMRTSFMRSLKIIAARIPAQSQQSFMSMQVEQFANPDTNNAYVSIFQFYLQGSDLDIDAVSMQTYDIDEDGILQGHSPYYSLESEDQRKASESLPFPNNRKLVESASVKVSECTLEQLLKKGIIGGEGTNSLIEIFKGKKVKDKVLDNGDIIEIFNGGIAGKVNIKLNLNNPQQIRTLGKLIEDFNRSGVFVKSEGVARNSLLKLINDSLFPGKAENEMLLDNKSIERIENTIINMINNHNTYLSRVNDRRREHIIKNYVTTLLFDIIEDPINREQADSSVDVVTGPVKDLSNSSPKATVQDVFTPGNVVNKFQSIAENMIGKDGIAICATGLKSFFALTELEQLMLAQGRGKELLFNVRIAGKTYHGLANGFSPEFKAAYEYGERDSNQGSYDPEVANYLIEQLWEADAANNMSAFLGLSTDNAKELVLAKINAGTATMGMYLYGLSIGVPIGELYRLMTSPLAFKLTELTKGDAFSYTPGVNGILGALRYLREEPSKYLSKFNDVKDPLDKKAHFDQPVDYLYREINKQILKRDHVSKFETEYLTALAKTLKLDDASLLNDIITKLRSIRRLGENYYSNTLSKPTLEATKNLAIAKFNQAIDYMISYLSDVALSKVGTLQDNYYGKSDIFLDLDRLAMGADEMKKIGQILRVNQEIKTRPLELIQQVSRIENCISDRIATIKTFNTRHGEANQIKAVYVDPKNPDTKTNKIDMLQVKDAKEFYKIDVVRFFTDDQYAQEKIAQYDAVKQSYNPLRIIHDVPHYRGYWESVVCSHEGAKLLSAKYRILGTKVPAFIQRAKVVDTRLKEQVYRNAESAIDTYFRRKWMLHSRDFRDEFEEKMKDEKFRKDIQERIKQSKQFKEELERKLSLSRDFRMQLPASSDESTVYAFVDTTQQARPNYYPREIVLGTTLGDANFKLWMERNIIPELKNLYPDNKFILDLHPILNSNTQLGVISINWGLPINMMPDKGDEYGQDLIREYREAFNQLSSAEAYSVGFNKKMALKDLFYLYSLISNNGRVGPYSLHGIMQDFDGDIVKSYRQSIAVLDKELTNPDSPAYKDILNLLSHDEVLAPFSTPWRGGSDIFKYKDNKVDFITLYRKSQGSDEEGELVNEQAQDLAGIDPDSGGVHIPNDYVIDAEANMLIGSDFNYFTFPESVATETLTTTSFEKGKILTQPIKNKKGEITGQKLIDIVPNNEFIDVLPQVIKALRDAYDGEVPMVTIVEGGVSKQIIDQSIINDLFNKYKDCP